MRKNALFNRGPWRHQASTKSKASSLIMHDYMAIKGNSSSAIAKQQRKEFLKMAAVNTVRVLVLAIIVLITTK